MPDQKVYINYSQLHSVNGIPNLPLLSRFVAIFINALFKENYVTKSTVVGKLYVLSALRLCKLFDLFHA